MKDKKKYIEIHDIIFIVFVLWDRSRKLGAVSDAFFQSIAHLSRAAQVVKYALWFVTPVSAYLLVMFVFKRYLNFEKKEKQPLRFTWDVAFIFIVVAAYPVLAFVDRFVIPNL